MRRDDGFDAIDVRELFGLAFDIGQAFADDEKARGLSGAHAVAEAIAHGAKFRTALQSMREAGDDAVASVTAALAQELAHFVITGELRKERIIAAAAPLRAGVGHA